MESAHLKELMDLESEYWWHVAKHNLANSLLRRYAAPHSSVVEGGIGAGGNLLSWKAQGYQVFGLDIMPESIAYARSRGLENVYEHDLHEPWPIASQSAQAVVMLDVLEHLRDPVQALRRAADVLDTDGKIIFTVPAHPWLYSEWDQRLGHFRRYTSRMMRGHVAEAGLRLVEMRPWNAISLPLAAFLRTYRRLFPNQGGAEFPRVSRGVNRLLIQIQEWEQRLAAHLRTPCGLSLVGVIGR
ncbi:MAG: class I SAM-dependent methyltransferase [Pirellulaceae bacterium]